MLTLGFLTTGALAAPLDDALGRLDRLEEQRGVFLARADSLGPHPHGPSRRAVG